MTHVKKHSSRTHAVSITRLGFTLAGAVLMTSLGSAHAQSDYPSRPITLIVPYNAGGSTDLMARVVAQHLGQLLSQPIVVENRGGVGSTLGTGIGAKAKPDGYTLVMTNGAAITTAPLFGTNITYDPLNDFTHLVLLGTLPNGFIVHKDNPAKTMEEFIANAKAANGKFNYGSAGVGSMGFLTGELLKQKANIDMTHIPYKGTGPAMNDLIGGQIDALLNNVGVASAQVKAGNARILAVSSPERMQDFPDIQTIDEAIPSVVGVTWFGIAGPKDLPQSVTTKLQKALDTLMKRDELRNQLRELGLVTSGISGPALTDFINNEHKRWEPVIKQLNITLN